MGEDRTLTEADVKAIIDGLEERAVQRFQTNVGKGAISLVSTWVLRAIVLVAIYGAGSSGILKKLGF